MHVLVPDKNASECESKLTLLNLPQKVSSKSIHIPKCMIVAQITDRKAAVIMTGLPL